uniref:COesterase domain-containing protein n=1 Tax=Panagrellus redivivus TaxID=6233 RepID=A0A7E4W079_PANRE
MVPWKDLFTPQIPGFKLGFFLVFPMRSRQLVNFDLSARNHQPSWTEPLQTKTFKKPCIPITKTWLHGNSLDSFSEDCLYLNIIAPVNGTNHPVLVYIHGGNFCFGDCVRSGFDKYVKNFVSRGVIVVTVAYRLGIYGYFSTGDTHAEGNNGLWDQFAPLNSSMKTFPTSVVIPTMSRFGDNPQCGIGTSLGNQRDASVYSTKKLATALGCEFEKSVDIKEFLKKQKPEDIIEVSSTQFVSDFTADRFDEKYLCFGVRIDNDFLGGKRVEELISTAPPKPTLFGLMANECGPFLSMSLTPDEIQNYSKSDVITGINKVISEKAAGNETDAIRNELASFYLDRPTPQEPLPKFYLNQHGQFTNDYNFNASVLAEMEQKANSKWPLYFYVWNHLNTDVSKMLDCKGGFHSYELWFISDEKVYPFDQHGPEEAQIAHLYCELLCNFAKSGNPSMSKIEIPRYTNDKEEALWIDLEPSICKNVYAEVKEFYKKLEDKYKYSVRSGIILY